MKITEVKEILSLLKTKPRQSLGQNFLIDNNILDLIVRSSEIKSQDLILEIGPGLGALTSRLALKVPQGEVIGIEKDKILSNFLISNIKATNVSILNQDATKTDYKKIVKNHQWKFIANLPYAITGFIFRQILALPNPPQVFVVLIQKEVAERIIGNKTHKNNLLHLMVHLSAENIKLIRKIKPQSFFPSPKVESAIIKLRPLSTEEQKNKWGTEVHVVMKIAKQGFSHPRKLLQRNLKIDNQKWEQIVKELKIDSKARAEDLNTVQWADLTRILLKKP